MHGDGYSDDSYAAQRQLLAALRHDVPMCLIFCTTTDVRERNKLEKTSPKTELMIRRNQLSAAFEMREHPGQRPLRARSETTRISCR